MTASSLDAERGIGAGGRLEKITLTDRIICAIIILSDRALSGRTLSSRTLACSIISAEYRKEACR